MPEQWPHIRSLYQRAGFTHAGHTEVVYLTEVADLPHPAEPPVAGLSIRRSVGINGTGTTPLGDTWTWDGSTWTKQAPATHPSARGLVFSAYDAATGTIVLFGGSGKDGGYLPGTWTWGNSG